MSASRSTATPDPDEFRAGMDVELEHGMHDLATNVTTSLGEDGGRGQAGERLRVKRIAARLTDAELGPEDG